MMKAIVTITMTGIISNVLKFDTIFKCKYGVKQPAHKMDYLKRHLNDYEDATQKEPKAKRALILALYDVLSVAETVEKEVKDKATFDALFTKSVSGKTKFTKALGELATHINDANKQLNAIRNDRKKAAKPSKPTAVVGGGAAPSNVIISDEDPVPTAPPTAKPTAVKPPKKPKKEKITLAMREQIWKKYIGRVIDCPCPVCQTRLISMTDFSAGHIVAEATGGATDITNLVPICGNCNSRMSTMDLFEYTQKNYMRAPVFPGLGGGK